MSGGIGSTDVDVDVDVSTSSVAGGSQSVRPIGVSPALTKLVANGIQEDWFRGNKWPPADVADYWTQNNKAAPTQFPRLYWSAFHYSIVVLGEFVRVTSTTPPHNWHSITLQAFPTGAVLAAEIAELVELVEYRPGVMSEALAQRTDLWAYYRGLLMCDSWSAPYTRELVEIATRVGQFQAMHYKRKFNRPRPSQISPALLPPIDVPGHASYPSGHATESHLISLCLAEVMPAAVSTPPPPAALPPPPPPQLPAPPPWSPLERMAQRIARNREVMGLHYPSDSEAGKQLAEESFKLLMDCPSIKDPVNGIIALAKKEWWP